MAFSKITLNNDTLMDVTQDTVASSNLLSGETATGADGETVEGAIEIKQTGPTVVPTFNTSTGNIHIEATTESGYYDSNKTTTGNYTPAAIGIPTQGSKTVTPSESAQSAVTAGKYTTGEVTVGAISSTYVGSGITQRNADDMTASGASVTAPAGYYAEASSKAIATATQATPSVEINSSTGLVTATSAQAAGYVSGGTKTGTLQLSAQGAKTVTPSESSQTAVAAGKYTTGAVTVGAVSSTYVGSGITKRSATDITADGAVVSVPAGYYASNGSKSVASGTATTPATSITANPTMSVVVNSGKNLFDQSCLLNADGWQENDGDYYGQIRRVLETYPVGTGVPIYGEFKENTQYSVSLTVYIEGEQGTNNGLTVVAYYSDGTHANVCGALRNQTSWLRISGTTTSGKTVTSILISYSNGGVNVWHIKEAMIEEGATVSNYTPYVMQAIVAASVSASQSVTPIVSAGYVSSGTAGTVSVSGSATEQLLFEAKTVAPSNVATVVTPGTASSLLATILPSSWTHPSSKSMRNTSYDFSDFIDGKTYRITGYISTFDGGGYAIGGSSLEIDETFDYAPSGENYIYGIEIPWKNSNQYKYYIYIYKNTGTLSISTNYAYASDGVYAQDDSFVSYNFYIYKVIPYNGLSSVTVNPIPSEYVVPTGTITLNQNGATDVSNYASAVVDVQPNVWVDSEGYLCLDTPVKDAVVFIDYDGTVLHTYTSYEFRELTSLPANPSHTGLVAQGWNWTKAQILEQMKKVPNRSIYVGQMYTTSSGNTEIDITLDDANFLSPWLTIGIDGEVSVNWGDGSSATTMTGSSVSSPVYAQHVYSQIGDYTIGISVVSGKFSFVGASGGAGVLRSVNSENNKSHNVTYSNSITAIRIGNNITHLNGFAFQYCRKVETITMPSTVTYINNYAFYGCCCLVSATIPSAVTTVGTYVFYGCYSLVSISIPPSVPVINNSIFKNCYSLASVTIPFGTIVDSNSSHFEYCYSITSVAMPISLTSIRESMFNNCYSLQSITIPSDVTIIGSNAFSKCYSLRYVKIPSGVTTIGSQSFGYCYSLESIELPSSVTLINTYAFVDCRSLKSIIIPSGVTYIRGYVFQNCYSLTSVTMHSGITEIGPYAFQNCFSLPCVVIPSSVTTIGAYAFYACYTLVFVTIPSDVTSIGNQAFQNCYSVIEYHLLPTTPPTLGTNAFANMDSNCIIYVPKGKLSDYQGATNWSTYASYMREEA